MGTSVQLTLLENASATGDEFDWPGGAGEFAVEASSWAGTVALHKMGPNGTYISLGQDVELNANGFGCFFCGGGKLKAVVTGTVSGIYAAVKGLGE